MPFDLGVGEAVYAVHFDVVMDRDLQRCREKHPFVSRVGCLRLCYRISASTHLCDIVLVPE